MVIFDCVHPRPFLLAVLIAMSIGCATPQVVTHIAKPQLASLSMVHLNDGSVGEVVTLLEHVGANTGTVFFWWSNGCPCVRRYQERIENLMREYEHQGIGFVAIASNVDETMPEVLEVARQRHLMLPIVMDHQGSLAFRASVERTPTVLLVDSEGGIAFRGWIDNERKPGVKGRIPYLKRSIDALLRGEHTETRSPIFGCRITRNLLATADDCQCRDG